MKLTKTTVEELAPPKRGDGQVFGWDDELAGFGVGVTWNGVRTYVAQGRVKGSGKTRRVKLGRHGVITAEKARGKAKIELGRMADGMDPSAERKRAKALAVTLREVVARYVETRRTRDGLPLKARTKLDMEYHLTHAFADYADRPIIEVDHRDVVTNLHSRLSKKSGAQADQAFRYLKAWINFARETYRNPDGGPIIIDNAVVVLGRARLWNQKVAREGHVPLELLGEWWSALQARRADPGLTEAGKTGADVAAFILLTGLRRTEGMQLPWANVGVEQGIIRLPDPKNRLPVTLPLSTAAVEIIKGRKPSGDYVFAGRGRDHVRDIRPTLEAVRATVEAKLRERGDNTPVPHVSVHDLRRSFIKVADRVGIERWRTKLLINHKLTSGSDITMVHYTEKADRTDMRPEADRVAAYLEQQRRIAEAANVLPLTRKAKGDGR